MKNIKWKFSLRIKLVIIVFAIILLGMALGTLSTVFINQYGARMATYNWLQSSYYRMLPTHQESIIENTNIIANFVKQQLIKKDFSHTLNVKSFNDFLVEIMPKQQGLVWLIVDTNRIPMVFEPSLSLNTRKSWQNAIQKQPSEQSFVWMDEQAPVFGVTIKLSDGANPAWLILGRRVDSWYIEQIGKLTGAEVAIFSQGKYLLGSLKNTNNKPLPLLLSQISMDKMLKSDSSLFWEEEIIIPKYSGYLPTIDSLDRGKSLVSSFLFSGKINSSSPDIPVVLVLMVPKAVMTQAIQKSLPYHISISVIIMILLVIITWVMSKKLLKPLEQLTFATQRISMGDYSTLVPIERNDEIGKLSIAFNEMTSQLEKSQLSMAQSSKMAAVGQLAGGIAHEINNPMGVILGFSQSILKRIKEDDTLYMPLKSIEREAIRCKHLVTDLLTFSRTSNSNTEITDLNSLIEDTLSLVEADAKLKNVKVINNYFNNLPQIEVNKNQIQQVIVNLCNNAIDAMPEGGNLTLTTKQDNDKIRIDITDTGQGMTEDVRQKIFEPFFSTKEVGKGTGLGLSLCYEIIEKHNGSIEVESEVGKGTKFRIILPL